MLTKSGMKKEIMENLEETGHGKGVLVNILSSKKQTWIHLALLFVVTILSYGLLINKLGFYYDDLPIIFTKYHYSAADLKLYNSLDRPFAYIFRGILLSILGVSALKWHVFMLLEWWLCCALVYLFLKNLFPGSKQIAAWASLLLVVFPAFSLMSVSVVYGSGLIYLVFFLLSFVFMERYFNASKYRGLYFCLSLMFSMVIFFYGIFLWDRIVQGIVHFCYCFANFRRTLSAK